MILGLNQNHNSKKLISNRDFKSFWFQIVPNTVYTCVIVNDSDTWLCMYIP